jgi:hypothetical protein
MPVQSSHSVIVPVIRSDRGMTRAQSPTVITDEAGQAARKSC